MSPTSIPPHPIRSIAVYSSRYEAVMNCGRSGQLFSRSQTGQRLSQPALQAPMVPGMPRRAASSLALKRDSPAAKLCNAKLPRRGVAEGTRTDEDPRQCRHRA